jgi:hypothetical protein
MGHDKTKYNIHSFLLTPIQPKELFGLLGRMLERHAEASRKQQTRRGSPAPARR